jgi:hypothetical protein
MHIGAGHVAAPIEAPDAAYQTDPAEGHSRSSTNPVSALTGVQTYTGENHVRSSATTARNWRPTIVFEPHEENQTFRVVKQAVYEVFNYAGSAAADVAAALLQGPAGRPRTRGSGRGRAGVSARRSLPRRTSGLRPRTRASTASPDPWACAPSVGGAGLSPRSLTPAVTTGRRPRLIPPMQPGASSRPAGDVKVARSPICARDRTDAARSIPRGRRGRDRPCGSASTPRRLRHGRDAAAGDPRRAGRRRVLPRPPDRADDAHGARPVAPGGDVDDTDRRRRDRHRLRRRPRSTSTTASRPAPSPSPTWPGSMPATTRPAADHPLRLGGGAE